MRHALWPCLLLAGCPAPSDSGLEDSGPPAAQVPADLSSCFFDPGCPYAVSVAHRGASRHAPENTLAAFEVAIELGAHAVELDVRTTSDGVLVLMHDGEVDRTTDGSGDISSMTWAEVQALTVPSEFAGIPDQRVPSFLEALEHIDGRLVVDVDVKDATGAAMAADIEAAGMVDRCFLLTKSPDKAADYRASAPGIAIMPNLASPAEIDDYAPYEPELAEVDFLDIAEAAPIFAERGVRLFSHGLGFETVAAANGTAEESWAGMIADGAQVIQTDYPELLVPYLASHNAGLAAR